MQLLLNANVSNHGSGIGEGGPVGLGLPKHARERISEFGFSESRFLEGMTCKWGKGVPLQFVGGEQVHGQSFLCTGNRLKFCEESGGLGSKFTEM